MDESEAIWVMDERIMDPGSHVTCSILGAVTD